MNRKLLVFLFLFLFVLWLKFFLPSRFKFWRIQPVFLIYSWNCWVRLWRKEYGFIQSESILPAQLKYINHVQVHTHFFHQLSLKEQTEFVQFIQDHYAAHCYSPTLQQIATTLGPSAVLSFFHDKDKQQQQLMGVISSKIVCFQSSYLDEKEKELVIYLNYVDFLCVHSRFRQQGVAPTLIQTHNLHLQPLSRPLASIFKREGNMTAIVPLTTFNTTTFYIPTLFFNQKKRKSKVVEIKTENDFLDLYTWIKKKKKKTIGSIMCLPEPDHLRSMVVEAKVIEIYGIKTKKTNNFQTVCFFQKDQLMMDGNKPVITVLLVLTEIEDTSSFLSDCIHCIRSLYFTNASTYSISCFFLSIQELMEGELLVQQLIMEEKWSVFQTSPTAFFLYNYLHPTVNANRAIILL